MLRELFMTICSSIAITERLMLLCVSIFLLCFILLWQKDVIYESLFVD